MRETEGLLGSEDSGVHRGTNQVTESGGSVLGNKEPDWIAAPAPTAESSSCVSSSTGLLVKQTLKRLVWFLNRRAQPAYENRVRNRLPREKHEPEETPREGKRVYERVFQHQLDLATVIEDLKVV